MWPSDTKIEHKTIFYSNINILFHVLGIPIWGNGYMKLKCVKLQS